MTVKTLMMTLALAGFVAAAPAAMADDHAEYDCAAHAATMAEAADMEAAKAEFMAHGCDAALLEEHHDGEEHHEDEAHADEEHHEEDAAH